MYSNGADNPADSHSQQNDSRRDVLFDAELDDVTEFWTSSDDVPARVVRENVYLGDDVEYPRFVPTRRQRLAIIIGLPVLCIALTLLMLGLSAGTVVGQAKAAKDAASGLLSGMKTGDQNVVTKNVQSLSQATATMRYETGSPVWELASFAPIVGQDVANARSLVQVADDVVRNGVKPMSKDLSSVSLKSFIQNGVINVEGLQSAVNLLGEMAPSLKRANESFSDMRPGVVSPLNSAIKDGQATLETLTALADNSDVLAEHVPMMLGANGEERHYLILAQSNAELRSVGGFPGSWGLMTVKDGKLDLGKFGSPQQIRQAVDAAADETFFYKGKKEVDMVSDVGFNPNYPRVGEMVSQIYALEQEGYGDGYLMVDGIVAVDPIFLGEIMKLTNGSVDVEGVHVDGSNAAEYILSRIYWELPVGKQDVMFAAIAQKAFSLVTGGLGDINMSDLGAMVQKGAANRNFMLWFRDSEEQDIMETVGLTGALETDPAKPVLGVYLDDITWSKMDWYISADTTFGDPIVQEDGSRLYHVTTTLKNHMTPEEAQKAPKYVTGGSGNELVKNKGEMITYVLLFSPSEGKLENVRNENEDQMVYSKNFSMDQAGRYQMASAYTRMQPNETMVITYDVITSPEATEPLQLDVTPTAQAIAGW